MISLSVPVALFIATVLSGESFRDVYHLDVGCEPRFEIIDVDKNTFIVQEWTRSKISLISIDMENLETEAIVTDLPFDRCVIHVPGSTRESLWWRHDFKRIVNHAGSVQRTILREFFCGESFVAIRPLRAYNNAELIFLIYNDYIQGNYRE